MGILIKPIVTEKLTGETEKRNRYGFIVERSANKIEIKNAVEQAYGVSVASVNTVNYNGKRKSRYTKAGILRGRMNHFKKAYVTLAGEDKIDFYANI
ncbi:MAG: 50S ribosomal protein L23 [Bacteroidales bacterium]|nr:50S ribosomal protein L23 [Bacteroidales bacterium]